MTGFLILFTRYPLGARCARTSIHLMHAMGETTNHPILRKAIQGLNVSKEFKAMARANRYRTLADILKDPVQNVPSRSHSGYRMLRELLEILREAGLEHYFEEDFD
jgi:hypothetical protein